MRQPSLANPLLRQSRPACWPYQLPPPADPVVLLAHNHRIAALLANVPDAATRLAWRTSPTRHAAFDGMLWLAGGVSFLRVASATKTRQLETSTTSNRKDSYAHRKGGGAA